MQHLDGDRTARPSWPPRRGHAAVGQQLDQPVSATHRAAVNGRARRGRARTPDYPARPSRLAQGRTGMVPHRPAHGTRSRAAPDAHAGAGRPRAPDHPAAVGADDRPTRPTMVRSGGRPPPGEGSRRGRRRRRMTASSAISRRPRPPPPCRPGTATTGSVSAGVTPAPALRDLLMTVIDHRSEQRLGTADATAALQVLERVEGGEHASWAPAPPPRRPPRSGLSPPGPPAPLRSPAGPDRSWRSRSRPPVPGPRRPPPWPPPEQTGWSRTAGRRG
jgi:hypothetical protein